MTNAQLLDACCKVERVLRSLGGDCAVFVDGGGVVVERAGLSPLANGPTLYHAVVDAMNDAKQSLDELE